MVMAEPPLACRTPKSVPCPPCQADHPQHPRTYRGLPGVLLSRSHAGHLGDDGCHVGGAVELDTGQAVLVGLHYTLDPCGWQG